MTVDRTPLANSPLAPPAPTPPLAPMLAKVAEEIPEGDGFLFEPKWDGFRAVVFRRSAGETYIQSREQRPLNRYFPELEARLQLALPKGCVIDGEIVVVRGGALDFDVLQQRLHPAASRVARLARETPASFVAFDLLAAGGKSTMGLSQAERRIRLERLLGPSPASPVHLTPMTRDRAVAVDWLQRFEGAGLDGVIAKPADAPYRPGKRAMWKIKQVRTADCVVAGFRWYSDSERGAPTQGSGARNDAGGDGGGGDRPVVPGPKAEGVVGSLLLGIHDEAGVLQYVGSASSFSAEMRRRLTEEFAPLRQDAWNGHPWRHSATGANDDAHRMPGAPSRWSSGKDTSWEPLRIERVAEVRYDHMQALRFRHATTFLRWRPDKSPAACRYDQLEVTAAFELAQVFGA